MKNREEAILTLACQRGLLDPRRIDDLRRTDRPQGEWQIIPDLVREGILSLDQLESLAREVAATAAVSPPTLEETDGSIPNGPRPADDSRFRIERMLGSGATGEVYQAFDTLLLRTVALKRLKADLPEQQPRLLREAQLQARIEHDNICHIYDIGAYGGRWFIAMQYIAGKTLKEMAGELTCEEKVKLLQESAVALHEAHRLGLVHRDVKPQNIMIEIGADGRLKPYLTDFGLVQDVRCDRAAVSEGLLGSLKYMSPEQAGGETEKIDHRTDIYSLGVTLYELLSGRLPLPGEAARVIKQVRHREAMPISKLKPGIPADLEAIVMKCLEKDPNRRYSTARELAEDLGRFLNGEPILARRYSLRQRWLKRIKKHKAFTAAAAVATLLVLLLAGLWLRAQWRSRSAAEAASRVGRDGEEIESIMRYAYLLPPHDIRADRQRVMAKITDIKKKIQAYGPVVAGPGRYALGQGYLALHDYPQAQQYLELAWQKGFQTPEAAYALATALGELYREELEVVERIPDQALRQQGARRLETDYVQPALRMLTRAASVRSIPAGYVEALILFYKSNFSASLKKLAEINERADWFYGIQVLQGDILLAVGDERWRSGFAADADEDYARAEEAYQAASRIGRSDPGHCIRFGVLYQRMAYCDMVGKNQHVHELLNKAISFCDQALAIDPESVAALQTKAYIKLVAGLMAFSKKSPNTIALFEEGLEAANEALELKSQDDQSLFIAGKILESRAIYESDSGLDPAPALQGAVAYLEKTLALNPNNVTARIELARVSFVQAEHQFLNGMPAERAIHESVATSSELAKRHPELEAAQSLLGSALYYRFLFDWHIGRGDETDLAGAMAAYEKSIALNPNLFYSPMILGIIYIKKAQVDAARGKDPRPSLAAALKQERRAAAINPGDLSPLVYEGQIHAETARYQLLHGLDPVSELRLADRDLGRAAASGAPFKEMAQPLLLCEELRARLALWRHQSPAPAIAKAKNKFQKGQKSNANYFELYDGYASVLLLLARYQIAMGISPVAALSELRNTLQKAAAIKPDDFLCHSLMGEAALLRAGDNMSRHIDPQADLSESEKEISTSLRLNPRHAHTFFVRAEWSACKSAWEKSQGKTLKLLIEWGVAASDQALSINPEDAEAYSSKSLLLKSLAEITPDQTAKRELLHAAGQALAKSYKINSFLKKAPITLP